MHRIRSLVAVLSSFAVLAFATSANAAVTTTAITAAIDDAATAGGVVGAAVVVMIVGIKVFKWLRKAL